MSQDPSRRASSPSGARMLVACPLRDTVQIRVSPVGGCAPGFPMMAAQFSSSPAAFSGRSVPACSRERRDAPGRLASPVHGAVSGRARAGVGVGTPALRAPGRRVLVHRGAKIPTAYVIDGTIAGRRGEQPQGLTHRNSDLRARGFGRSLLNGPPGQHDPRNAGGLRRGVRSHWPRVFRHGRDLGPTDR
jgi:hypothetical protein